MSRSPSLLDDRLVVADQLEAAIEEAQRKVRLARARRAADQNRAAVERDGAGVERFGAEARPAHGSSGSFAVRRRKSDGEAGARWRVVAVLHVNLPVMAFTIAWAMARPRPEWRPKFSPSGRTEWKRLKIASRASAGTPGPSSSMRMRTSSPTRETAISTRPPGGEKLTALSMMALIARARRSGLPMTTARVLARPSEGDPCIAGLAAGLPAWHELLDQRTEVDAFESGAGELGIGPRRLADVADQPVDPPDVLADDGHQAVREALVLDPVEPVHRRPQRGEGVLELVASRRRRRPRYCRSAGAVTGSCPTRRARAARSRPAATAAEGR